MTLFFAEAGGNPVIPWYANFSTTNPWQPPVAATDFRLPSVADLSWEKMPFVDMVEVA